MTLPNSGPVTGSTSRCSSQFGIWLDGILHGDFGISISLRRNVLELLIERLPATLELAIVACALAVLLGGATAIAGTLVRRSRGEAVIDAVNGLVLAVPDFVWALAFVLVLGVLWPVLPLSGRSDPSVDAALSTHFYLFESLSLAASASPATPRRTW